MSIQVHGEQEVFASFDAILSQITNGVDVAVQGAGIETESGAKKACPVDTGRLRSSIHYQKTGEGECLVGTNVEYAPFIELGTRKKGARPYLFPAFEAARKQLEDELNNL